MNTTSMTELQQSNSAVWQLTPGRSSTLPAVSRTRWLRVSDGRLWVTANGRLGGAVPDDAWVLPGQVLEVPAGVEAVLEGWPQVSFQLLEAAPATRRHFFALRAAGRLAGGLLARLVERARIAASSASLAQGSIRGGDSMASCGGVQ